MSTLSSLLNPTPSSDVAAPSEAQQLAPFQLDGQDHHSRVYQPGYNHAQSPIRDTVTSPGLDVLADAASSTAPLTSPTHQHSSMAQGKNQGQVQEPLNHESSGAIIAGAQMGSYPAQQQHSSDLQQQDHYGSDRERHIKDYETDSSSTLTPRYRSLHSQKHDPTIMGTALSSLFGTAVDKDTDESSHASANPQNKPTITQIRQSSLPYLSPVAADSVPNQAEQVHVKTELTETPEVEMKDSSSLLINSSASFQHDASVQHDLTPGTPLKNVISNTSPPPTSQIEDSSAMPLKPRSAPPKKRAVPKKGSAVKPPSKKRKVENESGKASPRTGTPATSRASGTPVPKKGKQDSATPTRSSSVANPEDDDDDGELELFCICRKPDDHTVMIGCDGPCEDWFHTRCVNMTNERVALISKWYCPNCAAEGHETEWKRMCRLNSCSKPARIEGPHRSKYCCDEHGQEFMERLVSANEKKPSGANTNRRRRCDNYTDHDGNEGDENDEQDDNRGGVLRPGELKALVDGAKDVATFRKLGDGVLSPPETAATSPGREADTKMTYSLEETVLLEEITKKREEIETRKRMLNDRETLVHLVDNRRKNVLAKLKEKEKSLKDICGYDVRLTWSDEEFNEWRASKDGRYQLDNAALEADPKLVNKGKEGEEEEEEEEEETEIGPGVCKKKRCERHRQWYKLQQQDNAMEKEDVRQRLRKLDEEEKGVKDRAMIRRLEEG